MRLVALFLLALPAAAGDPPLREVLDPFSSEFSTDASRTTLRQKAFGAAVAREGLAPAIRLFDDFEKDLEKLQKPIEKDHAIYHAAARKWWAWRTKYEKDHLKRHGRPPAEYPTPDGLNKDFLAKERTFRASRSLKLREAIFQDWCVEEVRVRLLRGDAEDHDRAVAAAVAGLKDKNPHQRLRCVRLLEGLHDAAAGDGLRAAMGQERHPAVLAAVVGGGAGAADLPACLAHPDWPVRAGAARAAKRVGGREVVPALIDRLGKEDGRIRDDVLDALRHVTGRDAGSGDDWAAWWRGAESGWAPPAPRPATGTPDPEAAPCVFSDGPVSFLGIPSHTRAAIYCIHAPMTAGIKDAVKQSLASLPDGALFGLVVSGVQPRRFRTSLAVASGTSRNDAAAFLDRIDPPEVAEAVEGDLHAALAVALDLAGGGRTKPPGADTLFLVAAPPSGGAIPSPEPLLFDDPRQIALEIVPINALLGVRIHAVGPSGGQHSFYLQALCVPFGGTHRE